VFKTNYFPKKVYIEEGSFAFPLTWRILKNLGDVPQEIIPHPKLILEKLESSQDAIGEGKKYLLLTPKKGEFIKPCPCTPGYVGCNYFIINSELNCPLDCSYCILQRYLTNPLITVHVNLEELWRQLDIFLEKKKPKTLRIGTGELSDSLALDHLTENSRDLISYFKEKKNAFFELKTKTTNIKNILETKPAENIVISWSLNSFKITQEEERGASPVEERIEAARKVSERGFRLGFHFDPLIRYSGWEEDYAQIVKKLLTTIPPSKICWISLGSLRFPPVLKSIIKSRFPGTKIIYDEFIMGKDGKFRYFRPLRLELYKRMIDLIKDFGGSKIPLYLCMESQQIWKEAMNWMPKGKEDIESLLSPPLVGQ
jgi:spore photoproduct lyase